ncbi:MAG: hypothetical protein MUF10_11055, partial [Thermoanaerobaculaceae bacterium]|nr:hypothetical protein [Thermoanaerobaculaceae bacterium]
MKTVAAALITWRRVRVSHASHALAASTAVGRITGSRMTMAVLLAVAAGALLLAAPAHAQLSVTPITWDVVGLDSNRPDTSGPKWFPVGARVCNESSSPISDVSVSMDWAVGSSSTYIINRPGSLTTLDFPSIAGEDCVDAYFEIELQNRHLSPFGQSRPYTIVASAPGVSSASTPAGRQILIEYLVSQNRNTTDQIRYCDPTAGGNCNPAPGGTGWVVLGAGGSISFAVGNEYYIELTSQTATAYEELESFVTLSNTIFQILSVSTTYETRTAPEGRVPVPNPQLWADGCLWDSDPGSTNYSSCLSSGKVGGEVITLYHIRIISGGGESVTLEALHYDRSGGSFHYNTDYSQSPGDAEVFDPTDAGFAKRFIPSTIAADGTATLVLTITNPNPVTVSGYNFVDPLPFVGTPVSQMRVANPTGAETFGCGSPTFAPAVGATSLSFSNGTVGPSGTCTIRVNVTVPLVTGATYPLTLTNLTNHLFVGSTDTGHAATATLQVTATPPPPQVCVREDLAGWNSFSSASAPTPTSEYSLGVASAAAGTGLTFSVPGNDEWDAETNVLRTLAQARTDSAYYEFRLNTTGLDEVYFTLRGWRQNGNAPDTLTLDYGPAGSLQESITFVVPEQRDKPTAANLVATNLTANLNPSGE